MVRSGEFVSDIVNLVLNIDRLNLRSWRHGVIDRHVFQIEQIHHDVAVFFRNELSTLEYQRAHFFHRQLMHAFYRGPDVHRAEYSFDDCIDDPHHHANQDEIHQCVEHVACDQRNTLRKTRTENLGQYFGKYQDGKRCRGGRNCQHVFAFAEQTAANFGDQYGRRGIQHRIAGEDERQHLLGLFQQRACVARAARTLLDKVPQPITIERHHAGFRHREKAGTQQQESQCCEQPA